MRKMIGMVLAMFMSMAWGSPAQAQETDAQDRVLMLADAYQDGYLQLAAVSCFNIYSSTGFIFGDFVNGVIDGQTAINSMEQIALLHTVAYTSITEIEGLTPDSDLIGKQELADIKEILERENALLSALLDLFSEGGVAELELVKEKLRLVEQALDDYTSAPAA